MSFTKVTPGNPLVKKVRHTRTDQFLWEEQSVDRNGNPYDYTGHSFKLQIKEYEDGPVVVEIPDGSFSIAQSQNGADNNVMDKFTIDHPPDDFADLIAEPFEYYYDIQITDASGKPFTPIVGPFLIIGD